MAAVKKYNNELGFETTNTFEAGCRTYGFIKTRRCDTPIPVARPTLETNELVNRISILSSFKISEPDTDSDVSEGDPSSRKASSHSQKSFIGLTPFEKKRQIFDTGEFTITKGRKLSEEFHPIEAGYNRPTGSFEATSSMFVELQNMCKKMNCKLAK